MKYVINHSEYRHRGPRMEMVEFSSLTDLMFHLMDIGDEDREEWQHLSEQALVDQFKGDNGDGEPYVTVFCVDQNKQVI